MSFSKCPAYKDSGVDWLGEVPKHWRVAPAGSRYDVRNGYPFSAGQFSPEGVPENRIIRIRDLLHNESPIYSDETSPPSTLVQTGNMLVGMDGDFNIAIWKQGRAKLNQRVCAIKGSSNYWDKFLFYGIQTPLKIINELTFSTTVKHLSSSQILKIRFPFPPETEMRQIVHFLDHETAKIDALIEEQQRLIELLKEKRQAVISQAVTKGLDANAPMKDSGVEWLGAIPAHWKCKSYRYGTEIYRGKFGHRPRNDPTLYDGSYPFIQTGDVARANKYISVYVQTLNEKGARISQKFPAGTLVMAIAANIGDTAILNFEAWAPDSIVGFKPAADVKIEFLRFSLMAAIQELEKISTQSAQANLNVDRISAIKSAFPPVAEQLEIIHHLNGLLKNLDDLETEAAQAIDLLNERRSALISAAVTGKIDVRNWHPPVSSAFAHQESTMEIA